MDSITECCKVAAAQTIPRRGHGRRIAGWKEFVAPFKEKSIFWHRLWCDNDRPNAGPVFEAKESAKKQYKRISKQVLRNQNRISSEKMADALSSGDGRDFWNEVKRKTCKSQLTPDKVDDAQGNPQVCDLFVNKYAQLYNSVGYDRNDMNSVMKNIKDGIQLKCNSGHCYSDHRIGVCDVRSAVKLLKSFKSDSENGMLSDHIIHGDDELYVHMSFLFNCMISHSVVPKQMLMSLLIPITKSRKKSVHDSDNYRSIALSSIIGKVLDRIFLTRHSNIFASSDLQFGFKKHHSTSQCTFVLNRTIEYYHSKNTNVFAVLLDASKAFDRVQYVKLFELLLRKGLCPRIAKLLVLMYTNQFMKVRWGDSVSNVFSCSNGVKQGGVLSPTLFCVFFDQLLTSLKLCGVGCYIGHVYVGALSYADDVVLLAPTRKAASKMLLVCEQFSEEFNVMFNASKSLFIHFEKVKSRCKYSLELKNTKINQKSQGCHLGNLIGQRSEADSIKKAASDLYFRTNLLMSNFGHCSINVIMSLFSSYCTSFYGSPLWQLNKLEPLLLAWRKCVKKIFKLNIRTRSVYVSHLMPLDLIHMLSIRFINFMLSCTSSNNPIINYVSKINLDDTVSHNLSFVSDNYHISYLSPQDIIKSTANNVIKVIRRVNSTPEEHYVTALAIIDLCKYRDNLLFIDSIEHTDIYDMLAFFTM